MSSEKTRDGCTRPHPPDLQGILADLKENFTDDVAFNSPTSLGFPEAASDHNLANTDLNQEIKHSLTNNSMDFDGSRSANQEDTWSKVLEFLSVHKDLAASKVKLKALENDITEKQIQLREAADQLRDSWESEKPNHSSLT